MKIDTLQKIEVAEGVEILLRPAGPVPRAIAFVIDSLLQIAIWLVGMLAVIILLAVMGAKAPGISIGVYFLLMFLLNWFYFVFFEVSKRGASPGKRAMGLKVVRTSGAPVGWGQSILRNFLRMVDGMPFFPLVTSAAQEFLPFMPLGLVGCGFMLMTRRFQRVGDLLGDTLVVYQARRDEIDALPLHQHVQTQLSPMPPPLALTKEEQQAVVLFLERAGLWSDARKEELANHAEPLTGSGGRNGVLRLMSMGLWLRDS